MEFFIVVFAGQGVYYSLQRRILYFMADGGRGREDGECVDESRESERGRGEWVDGEWVDGELVDGELVDGERER